VIEFVWRISVQQTSFNLIKINASTSTSTDKDTHEGVFKAVVIAKLTYASPAWWGFTTAHDRQKWSLHIRRGVRFGYCTTNQASLAELVADEILFKNIIHIINSYMTLHQLLPDRTQSTYNLRSRKHDCSLTV